MSKSDPDNAILPHFVWALATQKSDIHTTFSFLEGNNASFALCCMLVVFLLGSVCISAIVGINKAPYQPHSKLNNKPRGRREAPPLGRRPWVAAKRQRMVFCNLIVVIVFSNSVHSFQGHMDSICRMSVMDIRKK